MNLINELQISVERDDVLTVLRKARRLASKLGVTNIDQWLKLEQNGYEGNPLPSYREVDGSLVYKTNGPVPMGMGIIANGILDYPGNLTLRQPIRQSITEVIALIESVRGKSTGLYTPLDNGASAEFLRDTFHPDFAARLTFMLHLNIAQVRAIPEAVKDRVLDWACELEQQGVHGENMSFNEVERKAAHSITFNIQNSKIEQLNNLGDNIKGKNKK